LSVSHDHGHSHHRGASQKVLIAAFALTATYFTVELIGGIAFNSLALVADATHMFSDMVALALALLAQLIAAKPASQTHSFGWRRVEVLAALANGLLLLGVAIFISYEAGQRFNNPLPVDSTGVIAVASAGLLINIICTKMLMSAARESINVRAAAMHTFSDALGSVAVIVSGLAIFFGAPDWVDPVASLVVAALVVLAASQLVRQTLRVLLEATPDHIDPGDIEARLLAEPAVSRVHHLHVWSLAPGESSLSAHVELDGIETLHGAQQEGVRLKQILVAEFEIEHSTLELECHPCAPDDSQH